MLFGSCKAEFNVQKLLRKQIIDIKNVSLEKAAVNVLIDENGKLNWNIFTFEESEEEDETESEFKINELHIKKLNLNKIAIRYENQQTKDLFSIDSLSSDFKMGCSNRLFRSKRELMLREKILAITK